MCPILIAQVLSGVASADQLEFIVDRADGAVYIKNPTDDAITLDGYQIISFGGALIVDGWIPITGNYDLSGDQSVDASSDWFVLFPPTTAMVAEASLTSESGSLAAGQIVELGLFFDTTLLEGLAITTSAGLDTQGFPADFRTLDADYDNDLDVDLDDYLVFASTYGSTTELDADGNGDLVIDSADYTIWRDSPELVLTLPVDPASAVAFAIPEPSTAALACASLLLTSAPRRRLACSARAS